MRRSGFNLKFKEQQGGVYYPTPVESACLLLIQGNLSSYTDLSTLVDQIKREDGWIIEFHDEPNSNTASFSTRNEKKITVYLQHPDHKLKSASHLLASIMHEYLYGELVSEAKNSSNPIAYVKSHYHEFARYDHMIASFASNDPEVTNSVLNVMLHRQLLVESHISDDEIQRLLNK